MIFDLHMSKRDLRIAESLSSIGLAVLLVLAGTPGACFGQALRATHGAAPPDSKAILPTEVAANASEVANLLISLAEKSGPSSEIETIQQALPEISKQIDIDIADTSAILGEHSPLATLQAQQALWQRMHQRISTALARLTGRATELREGLSRLKSLQEAWTQTLNAAQTEQASEAILQQIKPTLASIEAHPIHRVCSEWGLDCWEWTSPK